MNFSKDWPSGCPADDTLDAAGEVFRIAKENPVTASCMESHHESGKLPKADPCLRCGLSVFRDVEDAINQRNLLPKLGDKIAKGLLLDEHGKACLTKGQQPTHTTWWPYEGVDRASLFIVIRDLS
jgi:hypothetical protein